MALYKYDGPVTSFGRVITERWSGKTQATSYAKAKNNLIFQFKRSNKLLPSSRIELPGSFSII